MAWIETVPPEEAVDELAELYRAISGAREGVAAIHRVQSLNPRAMRAHFELYKSIVFGRSSLDRRSRERIGVVVSRENSCDYCVAHHAEALRRLKGDEVVIQALSNGEDPESLDDGSRALLAWARRGASRPGECTERDILELRPYGFDDRAILDAALTVAYFSFVNRLVLLLGVHLEGDYEHMCGDG